MGGHPRQEDRLTNLSGLASEKKIRESLTLICRSFDGPSSVPIPYERVYCRIEWYSISSVAIIIICKLTVAKLNISKQILLGFEYKCMMYRVSRKQPRNLH